MERSVYGRVLEAGNDSNYDDVTLDAIGESIHHAVTTATHLDALCLGIQPLLHEADLESLQDLHPDRCAGADRSDLQQAALPSGAAQLRELQRVLEHNVQWNVPGEVGLQRIHNALAAVIEPPNSPVTPEQRTMVQQEILATVLWSLVDILPILRHTIEDATSVELRQARLHVEHLILHTLGQQRVFPNPSLAGLKRISEEYAWDSRRLFAAPAFFPELSYLIAMQIYDFRQSGPYVIGQPRRVQVRPNAVAVALDQLARLSRESTSRAEAFLSVIFSTIPVIQREVGAD